MATFGKKVWALHIWATAFMTLVAGIPHFRCRCPNGQVKPFCLGVSTKPNKCCCGGACCSASSGKKCGCCQAQGTPPPGQAKQEGCCAKPRPHQVVKGSAGGFRFEGASCKKTLAPAEVVTVAAPKVNPEDNPDSGKFIPTPLLTPLPSSQVLGECQLSWQTPKVPPPTDLVITLQHFVI